MRPLVVGTCLALFLVACATRAPRAAGGESVAAEACWLPPGAAPGMFVTWSEQKSPAEPDDLRESTLACVDGAGGVLTMERSETFADGSTSVTATRFRPDGTLVGAWRGPKGGAGTPLRVAPPRDPNAARERTDRVRAAYGLPPPAVSEAKRTEWVETPAGRFPCVKRTTEVSILFAKGRFETWHAVGSSALSALVKAEVTLPGAMGQPGHHEVTLLKAVGAVGARPTLTIPP